MTRFGLGLGLRLEFSFISGERGVVHRALL